jgi:hypothetical protein
MKWIRFAYLLVLLVPSVQADDVRSAFGVRPSVVTLAGEGSDRPDAGSPLWDRGPDRLDETPLAVRQQSKRSRAENGPTPGEPGSCAASPFPAVSLSGEPTAAKPAVWHGPDLLYVLMSLQR